MNSSGRVLPILIAAILCLSGDGCQRQAAPTFAAVPAAADDPRLTYVTPYKNVRPEVKYVGDEACAQCHPGQSETYRRHPMGRALAPVAARVSEERYDPASHNPFEVDGFQFAIERRGERIIHSERHKDPQGKIVSEWNAEVEFALGSGSHGRSYLINHDGFLFQSPISWYSQKQAWDLSPGYKATTLSDRQIEPKCLLCHCNHAEPVPDTLNRYRTPIFQGYAIGCERCHGPGELHVALRETGEVINGLDDTIVNPSRLAPALRESVCQQCHISGDARVLRRGRGYTDYRPGLPLHQFWSIYVRRPAFTDNNKSVSQVQQMVASRCFRESNGKMGCIACHDPHALPAADKKTAYYRGRCLQCHQETACSLPIVQRRQKNDDCAACHMPRFGSTDIAHTALTDHRILRDPHKESGMAALDLGQTPVGRTPFVHFHQSILDLPEREAARDRGIALAELARRYRNTRRAIVPVATPLLEAAVQAFPDDPEAGEARAVILNLQGLNFEALAACEAVLARFPKRESALVEAAMLCTQLKKLDEAIAYQRRAIEVNPWTASYYQELATLLTQRGQWPEAIAECRSALKLNPLSIETRIVLITCRLRSGEKGKARIEFDKLIALNPPGQDEIRRWFETEGR